VTGAVLDAYLIGLRCALPSALRVLPLPTILRLLDASRTWAAPARAAIALVRSERAARAIGASDTCLYRSLAKWSALRRSGVSADFVMGLRGDVPDTGHAWVEVDGEPVGEARDARLVVTYRYG
jgi:hypothetical protein